MIRLVACDCPVQAEDLTSACFASEGDNAGWLEVQNRADVSRQRNFELAVRLSSAIESGNRLVTDLNGFQVSAGASVTPTANQCVSGRRSCGLSDGLIRHVATPVLTADPCRRRSSGGRWTSCLCRGTTTRCRA